MSNPDILSCHLYSCLYCYICRSLACRRMGAKYTVAQDIYWISIWRFQSKNLHWKTIMGEAVGNVNQEVSQEFAQGIHLPLHATVVDQHLFCFFIFNMPFQWPQGFPSSGMQKQVGTRGQLLLNSLIGCQHRPTCDELFSHSYMVRCVWVTIL